jgi:hypothetical protein
MDRSDRQAHRVAFIDYKESPEGAVHNSQGFSPGLLSIAASRQRSDGPRCRCFTSKPGRIRRWQGRVRRFLAAYRNAGCGIRMPWNTWRNLGVLAASLGMNTQRFQGVAPIHAPRVNHGLEASTPVTFCNADAALSPAGPYFWVPLLLSLATLMRPKTPSNSLFGPAE